ncbi:MULTISPECIES: preprotein translocase subunit SecY [Hyphomonas]|uniref:Protein translocase subunit SecY n=1 Tax=Hyphomonas adhaerens TaxID=81029 RepID=A0A3B9GSW5_9PROT|nr:MULTISPECIES: preprotein translocase subunit SecY [Hyphomonas]MBB40562.1 preprotein translocase subunit SecY [Hyphomonas sp.]HAE25550.1 preprotein translocase subunit SecY [Hyphomonas adhaerens]|tara:strand:+ start:1782 stop:3140 length:1359 start_codon:yes stop_codon:yes gene_type:complete
MANAAEQMARNVNLGTFAKAKDLQNRILFTLGMLLLYRLGTFVPIPGLDPVAYASIFESQSGGLLGNMNMFAGGAVERMGIFALNVMPYITASIIIQMMTQASPTLEKLKKEGEAGRKQINQYTRYLTLAFALVQSFAISSGLSHVRIDGIAGPFFILTGVVTLTGGTMLLMWMGEQITARGIGNGVSLIIFAGIVAELPKAIVNLISQARATSVNVVFVIAIAAMVIALVVFIVFMERSQRRLLIQYPKRQQAHGAAQGQKSFLPLKINTAGVIPPIFASALLMLPLTVVGFMGGNAAGAAADTDVNGVLSWLAANFSAGTWTHIISYSVLVIFFTFFYTSIMFNPEETADNLRKYGGFIPGIRPGSNTAAYFDYVLTRLTVIGALYLTFVCVLPELLRRYFPEIPFYIGGTSLLIVVSVTMDTVTQIQSHLIAHQYEGMIKKSKLGGRKK